MKNIKILISALLFSCVFLTHAQEPRKENKTMIDMLRSTDWTWEHSNDKAATLGIISYDETTESNYWVRRDKGYIVHIKGEFYLSDEPETDFDKEKVGKATNGKYIIFERRIYEIEALSEKELILNRIIPTNIIGESRVRYIPTKEDWRGDMPEISGEEWLGRPKP